jgi:hypothetical protein
LGQDSILIQLGFFSYLKSESKDVYALGEASWGLIGCTTWPHRISSPTKTNVEFSKLDFDSIIMLPCHKYVALEN